MGHVKKHMPITILIAQTRDRYSRPEMDHVNINLQLYVCTSLSITGTYEEFSNLRHIYLYEERSQKPTR